jgi:hypothetical protein
MANLSRFRKTAPTDQSTQQSPSPKGWDLRRDPRCAIHALPGPDDDELSIRALAKEVGTDPAARKAVVDVVSASGVSGMIETASVDPLFVFDLVQVDVAKWLDIGQVGTVLPGNAG